MKKFRKNNKGFTLVELIIVIAIIAILTAVAAPQYIKYVDEGRWSTDQDNAQIFLTAVQTALADDDYKITDGSFAFDKDGFKVGTAATGTNPKNMANYCEDMGIDKTIKVTNQHKAEATNSYEFLITVSGNKVTGKWGPETSA